MANKTDRQKEKKMNENSKLEAVLQIASVDGVVGVLAVTQMANSGDVLGVEFKPITPEMPLLERVKKQDVEAYKSILAHINSEAQKVIDEGKLYDPHYIMDHLDIRTAGRPETVATEYKALCESLSYMVNHDQADLAKMFVQNKTRGKNGKTVISYVELPSNVAGRSLGGTVEFNRSQYLEAVARQMDENIITGVHEFGHEADVQPSNKKINGRQNALAHGVLAEMRSDLKTKRREHITLFEKAKQAKTVDEAIKILRSDERKFYLPPDCEAGLRHYWGNERAINIFEADAIGRNLCFDLKVAFKEHLESLDYRGQMLNSALHGKGPNNPEMLRVYAEAICDDFGITERMGFATERGKFVNEVMAYAEGKKELPLLEGVLTKEGKLAIPECVLDACSADKCPPGLNLEETKKFMDKVSKNKKYLWEHLDDIDGILDHFSSEFEHGWERSCPKEFLGKVRDAGYEILDVSVRRNLRENIGINGDRFDPMTGEELVPSTVFSKDAQKALDIGIVKKGELSKIEKEISQTISDIKSGKVIVKAGKLVDAKTGEIIPSVGDAGKTVTTPEPPKTPLEPPEGSLSRFVDDVPPNSPKSKVSKGIQPQRNIRQKFQRVVSWTETTPQGAAARAAGTFAGQAALMWGAHKIGKQWRSYEDVAKEEKMRVLFEQEIETDTSVRKAQTYIATSGMVVAGAGVGLAIAERVAVKEGIKRGIIIGSKSLPFVGAAVSAGCAIPRAMKGDWYGVGLELSSAAMDVGSGLAALATPVTLGASSTAAAYLTASSAAMNAFIAARDGALKNGVVALAMVDENGEIVLSQQRDKNGNRLPVVGATITYDHDRRNGMAVWQGLDRNGYEYTAQVGSFRNDKKHGVWKTYSEDGLVLEIANYKNDKLVGKYMRCDLKGRPVAFGDYTNGHFVEYWTDSQGNATNIVKWECDFKNGQPVGIRRDYNRDGSPLNVIDYDKGEMQYVLLDFSDRVIVDKDGNPTWISKKFEPRTQPKLNARMRREMGIKDPEKKPSKPSWNPRSDKNKKKKVDEKKSKLPPPPPIPKPPEFSMPEQPKQAPKTEPEKTNPAPKQLPKQTEPVKENPAPKQPPKQAEPGKENPAPKQPPQKTEPMKPVAGKSGGNEQGKLRLPGEPSYPIEGEYTPITPDLRVQTNPNFTDKTGAVSNRTVVTRDGRVWQAGGDGRFSEVGKASVTKDGNVHIVYKGGYTPPKNKVTEVQLETNHGYVGVAGTTYEKNEKGTYRGESKWNPPGKEQKVPPKTGSGSGIESQKTEPTQPVAGKLEPAMPPTSGKSGGAQTGKDLGKDKGGSTAGKVDPRKDKGGKDKGGSTVGKVDPRKDKSKGKSGGKASEGSKVAGQPSGPVQTPSQKQPVQAPVWSKVPGEVVMPGIGGGKKTDFKAPPPLPAPKFGPTIENAKGQAQKSTPAPGQVAPSKQGTKGQKGRQYGNGRGLDDKLGAKQVGRENSGKTSIGKEASGSATPKASPAVTTPAQKSKGAGKTGSNAAPQKSGGNARMNRESGKGSVPVASARRQRGR